MENNEAIKSAWKNPRFFLALTALLLVGAILALAILRERFVSPPQWQLSFSGQGKVAYQPDIAILSLGVNVDKKAKAEDALAELNAKIKAVYEAIEKSGVDKKDIQTQTYSLFPSYDYVENTNKLAGYSANQLITVKIHEIDGAKADKPSEIIKAAGAAGANQINGVSFETSRLDQLREQARAEAISKAQKNAVDQSGRLGVKLGKIVGWWENYNPTPVYYGDYGKGGMGGGESAPSLPAGSNELIVEVNLSYLIK